MKKTAIILISAFFVCACTPQYKVIVENISAFDRAHELVEIPVAELGRIAADMADGETYVVKRDRKVVPSQVTHDGLLLFQSGLGAGEKAQFTVSAGLPQEFTTKTYGRFAPERMDDFIWENDRVAFRIYGEALKATDGPSNGIDALYKRSEEMVLDQWYRDELQNGLSYHDDHGTGLDDYKVGRTLGAGAMAPYSYPWLILNENFKDQELLDNGPLRTTFRLVYPDLKMDNDTFIKETRTISIDAGSQLSKIVQEYGVDEPIKVAAGFPLRLSVGQVESVEIKDYNHAKELLDVIEYIDEDNWMMLAEPATPKTSGVYMGLVMPKGISFLQPAVVVATASDGKPTGIAAHLLAMTDYEPGQPITYYTGYAWKEWWKQPEADFAEYLANFSEALKVPFVITIK